MRLSLDALHLLCEHGIFPIGKTLFVFFWGGILCVFVFFFICGSMQPYACVCVCVSSLI